MIHLNSLAAYHDGKLDVFTKRQRVILGAFERRGAMTDRECAGVLGFAEMNAVRPRITELVNDGVLEEVESVLCPVTKKTVRRCRIASERDAPQFLPGFEMEGSA